MGTKYCSDVNILVSVIMVLFGMGSWIAINGIWVELPLLVDQLPEGWNLPSYMTVVIQIANIGPITYTLWNVIKPNKSYEIPVVFVMVIVGSVSSLLLAFFWMKTSHISGTEHSTALLILMFFLSLVDCTSSVVFLPFMNTFKPAYITPYYIGEGFSGLVPSLVALGQGVGQIECQNMSFLNTTTNVTEYSIQAIYLPAKFPVKDFFLFIFGMVITCGVAFFLLNYLPYCKREHVNGRGSRDYEHEVDICTISNTERFVEPSNEEVETPNQHFVLNDRIPNKKMSLFYYIYFLLLTGWANALTNGILPSLQTYACLPYGTEPYHFAVTLSNISNPVACFIAFLIRVVSSAAIGAMTLFGTIMSGYIVLLAVGSPVPVLADSVAGDILVVTAYIVVYLILTYIKVSIAVLFRFEGRKALLWYAAIAQLGSTIGAAMMFVVVNVYNLLQQRHPCT